MKRNMPSHGRETFEVDRLSIYVSHPDIHVENTAPFLVRGKFYYEPEIRGSFWEESSPEHWEWETLYSYQTIYMTGPKGITLSITPACDLLELLSDSQLNYFFECLKKTIREQEDA